LKSAPTPFYPTLARPARVTGAVTIDFVITEQGDTSEIRALVETEAVNAKELLRQAAVENLQSWKFAWPHPCNCHAKGKAIFVYKLSGKVESPVEPTVTVRWFGRTGVIRVEIESARFQMETTTSR
jgi:outer membrane biosynthesis protein TonB